VSISVPLSADKEDFWRHHKWVLGVMKKIEETVALEHVIGVMTNTKFCSGLVKEMYSEFYTRDVKLMNEVMQLTNEVQKLQCLFHPSVAIAENWAIAIYKD
jgi:hypothetical protein